jgi:hypothetical protein
MRPPMLGSTSFFELGCELRALERDETEIYDHLMEANLERCEPPYPEAVVREIAKECACFDPRRLDDRYYSVVSGMLAKDGKPMCNFDLEIKIQRVYDDGVTRRIEYLLSGRHSNGERIPEFSVTSDEFHSCDFVKKLGLKAVVNVGAFNREHLKAAIQTLSLGAKVETIYSHTGFREINGETKFLHANGALGASGNDSTVLVDASSAQLHNICLETPLTTEELRKFSLEILEFMKIGPSQVMVPLVAFVFRAPTASILKIAQVLFITGPSGVFKTVLLGLMMAFYGRRFNHLNIPGNFESTANAIERMGYLAKDVVFGIDDYAPDGSLYDVQGKSKVFQRISRGVGNGEGGRHRMSAEGGLRTLNYFRGGVAATGEDIPKNFSIRARMSILAIGHGDIDQQLLSRFQEHAARGHFAKVMGGYISWLCPKMQTLSKTLPQKMTKFRDESRGSSSHRRTPEAIANLAIGYELFLDFVLSVGAIDDAERESLWNEGWIALGQMAEMQRQYLKSEDVALNFVEYIKAALLTGKAHLSNFDDCKLAPAQTDLWGWFFDSNVGEYRAKGTRIGWFDPIKNEVLLQPDAAYAAAQEFARSQGGSINITKDVLWKRLSEKGLIFKSDTEGKNLIKRTPDGENRRRLLIFPDPNLFLIADIRNYESEENEGNQGPSEGPNAD